MEVHFQDNAFQWKPS